MKNIGKPCTEKPYARFDEGGQTKAAMVWLVRHSQTKGTATVRLGLRVWYPALYSTPFSLDLAGVLNRSLLGIPPGVVSPFNKS